MDQDLLTRRDAARALQDGARVRWPTGSGPAYVAELRAVKQELAAVTSQATPVANTDPELARAWRYLGDVCLDLCNAGVPAVLEEARIAYARAEVLWAPDSDDAEAGRLAFNAGSVFFLLADGSNQSLLEQAAIRARRAARIFALREPNLISRAEILLKSIEDGLQQLITLQGFESSLARGELAYAASRELIKTDPEAAMTVLEEGTRDLPGEQQVRDFFRGHVQRSLDQAEQMRDQLTPGAAHELVDTFVQHLLGGLRDLSSGFGPTANSDAERLRLIAEQLRGQFDPRLLWMMGALGVEVSRRKQPRDVARTEELLRKCVKLGLHPLQPGSAQQPLLELASEVQQHARRYNIAVAFPYWPSPPVDMDCHNVYFAGRSSVLEDLTSVGARLGLRLAHPEREGDVGAHAWNQLRSSAAAVFDVGGQDAKSIASVYYEYGLALALGVPSVLLTGSEKLPFDVEDAPVRLPETPGADCLHALEHALQLAVFRPPLSPISGDLSLTERELRRLVGEIPNSHTAVSLLEMSTYLPKDPTLFSGLARQALTKLRDRRPVLSSPRYPPRYPEGDRPRCFHVFPFSQAWSDATSDEVGVLCKKIGCEYVRADHTAEPRAVKSIWDELGKATHVLVDVSTPNPNVAIELAIAHAFGKNVKLMARQPFKDEQLIPHIRHTQVHAYREGASGAALEAWLGRRAG